MVRSVLVRSSQHQEEEAPSERLKELIIQCVTQFLEVRLGEKRTHWFLIMVRNSNTSQGSVSFAAKEDPFTVKSDLPPKKGNNQSSLIQQIFIEFLLCPWSFRNLHMVEA